jgi:hypothetical protein
MQMRLNGVVVNETPRFQCETPDEFSHSVVVMNVNGDETITIPLFLKGVTSCMTTRKPTQWEFENCDHFELTAEHPVYDPHCESYASQESDMTDANGQLRTIQKAPHPRRRQICSVAREVSVIKARYSDTDAKLQHINEALDDKILLVGLHRNVQISEMNMSSLNVTVRKGVSMCQHWQGTWAYLLKRPRARAR